MLKFSCQYFELHIIFQHTKIALQKTHHSQEIKRKIKHNLIANVAASFHIHNQKMWLKNFPPF